MVGMGRVMDVGGGGEMEEGRGSNGGKESDGAHSPQIIVACVCSWVLAVIHVHSVSLMGVCFHSWTIVFIHGGHHGRRLPSKGGHVIVCGGL